MATATKIRVSASDIRNGRAADCFRCAVARALQRATGDDEAHVNEIDYLLRLHVWGRIFTAPQCVTDFIVAFDRHYERYDSGRVKLPRRLPEDVRPFSFTIPPLDDPEWEEQCYHCEELCDPKTLDDEGVCQECREGAKEREELLS